MKDQFTQQSQDNKKPTKTNTIILEPIWSPWSFQAIKTRYSQSGEMHKYNFSSNPEIYWLSLTETI